MRNQERGNGWINGNFFLSSDFSFCFLRLSLTSLKEAIMVELAKIVISSTTMASLRVVKLKLWKENVESVERNCMDWRQLTALSNPTGNNLICAG